MNFRFLGRRPIGMQAESFRRALVVTLLVAVLAACARRPAPPSQARPPLFYVAVPPSDITALELDRTACYGRCPAYRLRFTADDRATYVGELYAPRSGTFESRLDFARLAAWVDTQRPDLLAPAYATNVIDSARATLVVERGAKRTDVTTAMESETPLRFQGIVWALDGIAGHLRWTRVDERTPFIGLFAHGDLLIEIKRQGARALEAERLRPCGATPIVATRVARGVRLSCGARTSVFTPTSAGLRAVGDALPAGDYARIGWREAERRRGIVPPPAPE